MNMNTILRKSNLIPNTHKPFNPRKKLLWSSLCLTLDVLMVDIEWAKNMQFKCKELQVSVIPLDDNCICLVANIHDNSNTCEQPAPCACLLKKVISSSFSHDQFSLWLKLGCSWQGKPLKITPHTVYAGAFLYEAATPG